MKLSQDEWEQERWQMAERGLETHYKSLDGFSAIQELAADGFLNLADLIAAELANGDYDGPEAA